MYKKKKKKNFLNKVFFLFTFVRIIKVYRAALCATPPPPSIPVDESNWQKRCSNASLFWTNGQKDASSSVGRFIARFHVGELSTRAPLHRKTGYPNHSVVIWPQKLPFLLGDVRSCSAELD